MRGVGRPAAAASGFRGHDRAFVQSSAAEDAVEKIGIEAAPQSDNGYLCGQPEPVMQQHFCLPSLRTVSQFDEYGVQRWIHERRLSARKDGRLGSIDIDFHDRRRRKSIFADQRVECHLENSLDMRRLEYFLGVLRLR